MYQEMYYILPGVGCIVGTIVDLWVGAKNIE